MGMDEGRTATELTKEIDVTTDGEYADHDEVKIVMTGTQADKLAELLARHIDLDVVALDNDDPQGALFVTMLIDTIRNERDIAREAHEAS
jgi:hypothetical protein